MSEATKCDKCGKTTSFDAPEDWLTLENPNWARTVLRNIDFCPECSILFGLWLTEEQHDTNA